MANKTIDKNCSIIYFFPDNLLDYIFLNSRTFAYYFALGIGESQETSIE